jgi:tight adherence protein C
VNPLLPALALVLCVLAAARGFALLRSVPAGSERALGPAQLREERGSLIGALRRGLSQRFGHLALRTMSEKRRALTRHRLDAAGRPGGLTLEGYAGVKAASTILFAAVGALLTLLLGSVFLIPLFGALGWLQTDIALAAQAKRRQAAIDRSLPDFLDVLTVTVGAGLGFRTALGRVADAMGGPLGQEVRTALEQMGYGAARRLAFQGIRERNDSESLGQFMTALLQAEELGAPLGATLAHIAEDMRSSFAQEARRQAAKAVPRVSVIVTTLVVPAVAILLLSAIYVSAGGSLGSFFG